MNILLVDDEELALKKLKKCVEECCSGVKLKDFTNPVVAYSYVKDNNFTVDIAFLDIEMPGMTGITLAHKLKELNPKVNIVFVTGFSQYMAEAFSLRASGYLEKPITAEKITEEINNLRHPIEAKEEKGVFVTTFGNFGVSVNGVPVTFTRAKSKEILAYLVDRKGVEVKRKELASVLFEESDFSRTEQNRLSIIIHDLKADLKAAGIEEMMIKKGTSYYVDIDAFRCDSYGYLNGEPQWVNAFQGEYMQQYDWAEYFKEKFYR